MFEQGLFQKEEQSFNFNIGQYLFLCRLYKFHEMMYIDIKMDNEELANGVRVVQNKWILPDYIGLRYGNLRFETYTSDLANYVDYTGFNDEFKLKVYRPEEFKDMI